MSLDLEYQAPEIRLGLLLVVHSLTLLRIASSIAAAPDSEAYWQAVTSLVSAAPELQESNVMSYSYIAPAQQYNGTLVGGALGALILPNGTVEEIGAAAEFLRQKLADVPGTTVQFTPIQYASVYDWYESTKNAQPIGRDNAVGNRLLDAKALSNLTALEVAMRKVSAEQRDTTDLERGADIAPPGHTARHARQPEYCRWARSLESQTGGRELLRDTCLA